MTKALLNKSYIKVDPNTVTLEQLHYKRAEALIRLELCKAQLSNDVLHAKEQTREQGLRGLLFSSITTKRLRTIDYLLLGLKGAQLIMRLHKRKRARR